MSEERMIQSMEIARRIGAKAVVFHTNANPFLTSEKYIEQMVLATSEFVGKLLDEYRDIVEGCKGFLEYLEYKSVI